MEQFNSIDFVMEERNKTLGEFIIENQNAFQYSSGELSRIINSIRLAAKVVNYKVNKAGLVDIVGAAGDQNIQGEDQKKLDVIANRIMKIALCCSGKVNIVASEEDDEACLCSAVTDNKAFSGYNNNNNFIFVL